MKSIILKSLGLYRRHIILISSIVVVIWLPFELMSSYLDYFVFGPDDLRRSFKLAQLLDNTIGLIPVAAVISLTSTALLGETPSFQFALREGLGSWCRMWWTRVLSRFALILGLLLLVVPGIILYVRLAVLEQVVVQEKVSGFSAMKRSFELTKGRFWQVVVLGLVYCAVLLPIFSVVVLPSVFLAVLDNWLIDAASMLILDIVGAFSAVLFVCAYECFLRDLEQRQEDEVQTKENESLAIPIDPA